MITIPALAVVKPTRMATIVVRRGDEWQSLPATITEVDALILAKECRARGMVATVEVIGG